MALSTKSWMLIACLAAACTGEVDRTVGTDMVANPATLRDVESAEQPEITFEQTEVSTGQIAQGDIFTHTFHFTNTGEAPLVISSVQGSCGCTTVQNFPDGKIMPGEGGSIDVSFNSDNKWGQQVVSITVLSNTQPAATQLIIRTDIVVPDKLKKPKQSIFE